MQKILLKARNIGFTSMLLKCKSFRDLVDLDSLPWWMKADIPNGDNDMAITQADINNWFSYHPPTPEQLVAYNDIRQAAKIYAETVNRHVPDSADKTAAMRKIRESVMAANLAVACYQKPTVESLEAILKSDENPTITVNSDGSITTESE